MWRQTHARRRHTRTYAKKHNALKRLKKQVDKPMAYTANGKNRRGQTPNRRPAPSLFSAAPYAHRILQHKRLIPRPLHKRGNPLAPPLTSLLVRKQNMLTVRLETVTYIHCIALAITRNNVRTIKGLRQWCAPYNKQSFTGECEKQFR